MRFSHLIDSYGFGANPGANRLGYFAVQCKTWEAPIKPDLSSEAA
ncbi:MAG: hypothetical protein JWM43_4173 [Acidobacteriaceae bacterium]|nr:hypothetical protein [Acidobacteriaceae bacterium]